MSNFQRWGGYVLAAVLCAPVLPAAPNDHEPVTISAEEPQPAPDWALLERHLIEAMNRAGEEFYETYVLPDGTLRWKERYEFMPPS